MVLWSFWCSGNFKVTCLPMVKVCANLENHRQISGYWARDTALELKVGADCFFFSSNLCYKFRDIWIVIV